MYPTHLYLTKGTITIVQYYTFYSNQKQSILTPKYLEHCFPVIFYLCSLPSVLCMDTNEHIKYDRKAFWCIYFRKLFLYNMFYVCYSILHWVCNYNLQPLGRVVWSIQGGPSAWCWGWTDKKDVNTFCHVVWLFFIV